MDLAFFKVIPSWALQVFAVIGAIVVISHLLQLISNFYIHFVRGGKNLKRYGQWAIVTGCTDGIGKAIAEEFAKRGLDLVLISRTQSKLMEQAKELESKFKVKTQIVAVDFSSGSPNLLDPVRAAVKDMDIGILVNNVGMAYDHAEYFHELDASKIEQLVRVNITGTTMMSHLVLPGMVARKRGAIINVSSGSSLISEPLYAVYTGSKAYINNFSESLHSEYKRYGIQVQAQLPGLVTSKLSKIRSPSFFVPNPTSYAKAFVSKIGYEPISISYWTHALQFGIALSLPRNWLSKFLLSRGLDIRARALKKKQQDTKSQ